MSKSISKAKFPNLKKYRTQLGLEISDIVAAMPNDRPAESSVRCLDNGYTIRAVNANKVCNFINSNKMDNTFVRSEEIIEE